MSDALDVESWSDERLHFAADSAADVLANPRSGANARKRATVLRRVVEREIARRRKEAP